MTDSKKLTRTFEFYGKTGKAKYPTRDYPSPTRVVVEEAELVKDYGFATLWKFPLTEYGPEEFYRHYSNGSGGHIAYTLDKALESMEREINWRDYERRKRQLWQEYESKLKELNAEFAGRI